MGLWHTPDWPTVEQGEQLRAGSNLAEVNQAKETFPLHTRLAQNSSSHHCPCHHCFASLLHFCMLVHSLSCFTELACASAWPRHKWGVAFSWHQVCESLYNCSASLWRSWEHFPSPCWSSCCPSAQLWHEQMFCSPWFVITGTVNTFSLWKLVFFLLYIPCLLWLFLWCHSRHSPQPSEITFGFKKTEVSAAQVSVSVFLHKFNVKNSQEQLPSPSNTFSVWVSCPQSIRFSPLTVRGPQIRARKTSNEMSVRLSPRAPPHSVPWWGLILLPLCPRSSFHCPKFIWVCQDFFLEDHHMDSSSTGLYRDHHIH